MHHDDLRVGSYYRESQDGSIMKLKDKWISNLGGVWEMEFECLIGDYPFYGSGRPEFDSLEEIQILEAQVWAPRRDGEYVEIEMFAGDVVEYIGCVSGARNQSYLDDFLKHYELETWAKEAVEVGGATCCKCGKFFEYAHRTSKFRCWACRNGY